MERRSAAFDRHGCLDGGFGTTEENVAADGSGIKRVGIVGLGTMGAGIAEVFTRSGYEVRGVEVSEPALAAGRGHLERSTSRAVARGRLSEDAARDITGRVAFSTDLGDLADCSLVLEAVPERAEIKRELLGRLDALCPADTILATNTSSLSVTDLAMATGRPDRVLGMHFFNPAPVMRLVEVVRTVVTDPAVVADVQSLTAALGKTGVTVLDRAGFVANRLLFGYLNAAVGLLDSGAATRADVDTAMRVGCGLPMGPFTLLEVIGLDTSLSILETVYEESRDRRYAPPPLLRQLVAAGRLGRKSGGGLIDADPAPRPVQPAAVGRLGIVGTGEVPDRLAALAAGADLDVVGPLPSPSEQLAGCDVVLEAGEGPDGPARCAAVDSVLGSTGVIVTTSGPVVACAAATTRPDRVVGLYPYAGAAGQRLAEVVAAVTTSASAVATAYALAQRLGLEPVTAPDTAGGIVNRLLLPYLNDAVAMVDTGYATADDVDAAMTLGCGYPAGPIATLDAVGLDLALDLLERLSAEFGEPGIAPAPLLRQLVMAGRTGRGNSGVRERS